MLLDPAAPPLANREGPISRPRPTKHHPRAPPLGSSSFRLLLRVYLTPLQPAVIPGPPPPDPRPPHCTASASVGPCPAPQTPTLGTLLPSAPPSACCSSLVSSGTSALGTPPPRLQDPGWKPPTPFPKPRLPPLSLLPLGPAPDPPSSSARRSSGPFQSPARGVCGEPTRLQSPARVGPR